MLYDACYVRTSKERLRLKMLPLTAQLFYENMNEQDHGDNERISSYAGITCIRFVVVVFFSFRSKIFIELSRVNILIKP